MAIKIAGYPVALGDRLYSRRAAAWGTIIQMLDSAAVFEIVKGEQRRTYTVQENGVVAGAVDIQWHAPLELSLPKSELHKLQKIQTVVDALRGVL